MLGCLSLLYASVCITVIDLVLLLDTTPTQHTHTKTQNKNPPVSIKLYVYWEGSAQSVAIKENTCPFIRLQEIMLHALLQLMPTQPQTVTVSPLGFVINHANTSATFWNSVSNHQWRHLPLKQTFILHNFLLDFATRALKPPHSASLALSVCLWWKRVSCFACADSWIPWCVVNQRDVWIYSL